MRNKATRLGKAWFTALLIASLFVFPACGKTMESGSNSEKSASNTSKEISIGYIPWDEDIAVSYLWKALLEEKGYKVKLVQAEVAPVFSGVANGSVDLFMDVWSPITHESYIKKFGSQFDVLGTWYDQADSGLAVPDYVDVKSIEELKEKKDQFKGKIIGIEAGAGLMRLTREGVMPKYDLKDWQLVESGTPAMLAELEKAIGKKEPIVVTLWRPHWAFSKYKIRYLEDPQNILNPQGAEKLQTIGRKGFAEDYPEVANWLGKFKMNLEQLGNLESTIQSAPNEETGVQEWLKENREDVDLWLK